MLYRLGWFLSLIISRLICRVKVEGNRNVPQKGAFILASNHISDMDPFLVGTCITRKLNYMAKKELFANKFWNWMFRKWGAFPVDREKADISAIKEAIKLLNSGKGLLLFPEGGKRDGIENSKVQDGVGFLASKTQVPVIPVFIKGADKAMPKNAKFIKPADINVRFGEKISIERGMPYHDASLKIVESIRHLAC